jgi:hypothetical protein
MNKLFFHPFDLAILNNYILLSSCGGRKISLRDFPLVLWRNMLKWLENNCGCRDL